MGDEQLSTPTIVEEDGWTLASGSESRPSEAELRQALGAQPTEDAPPPTDEPEPPPVEEPGQEPEPAGEPEPPPPAAEAAAEAGKKRRTHDPQKRIDRMTADLATERQRREALERELAMIRLATQPGPPAPGAPPPAQAAVTPPPAAAAPPATPKPTWGGPEGYEAQGKTWEEYETASQQWTQDTLRAEMRASIDARIAEERQRLVQDQQRSAADVAFQARVEALRAKRPDFDEVVGNLGDLRSPVLQDLIYTSHQGPELGLHLAEHVDQARTLANTRFTMPVVDALKRASSPVKVLEYLATHPKEMEQVLRLDPVGAIVSIGRLDARLNVAPSVTTGAASTSVTSARPPLRTVGGGAPISRTAPDTPSDDIPFGLEYVARGNAAERERRERTRGF